MPPRFARIHRFKLFVSVTFDSLLADAINATRFGGNAKTEEIAYSPNDIQDLTSKRRVSTAPWCITFWASSRLHPTM